VQAGNFSPIWRKVLAMYGSWERGLREHVQKCMVTDVSVFQVVDGLGHACTVRVSRLFWVSTADVKLKEYYSTLIRDEHETAVCLMK
jgi:hypothetical protein